MTDKSRVSSIKLRLLFFSTAVFITPVGFFTKFYLGPGSGWVQLYAGDIFYPVFWYFLFLTVFPHFNYLLLAGINLIFDALIEFTQLINTPLLASIRKNFLGRTIIGSGFDKNDLIYYIAGNILAIVIYCLLLHRLQNRR